MKVMQHPNGSVKNLLWFMYVYMNLKSSSILAGFDDRNYLFQLPVMQLYIISKSHTIST